MKLRLKIAGQTGARKERIILNRYLQKNVKEDY